MNEEILDACVLLKTLEDRVQEIKFQILRGLIELHPRINNGWIVASVDSEYIYLYSENTHLTDFPFPNWRLSRLTNELERC